MQQHERAPTTTSLYGRADHGYFPPLAVPILLGECALARPGCPLLSGDVAPQQRSQTFPRSWLTWPMPSPSFASATDRLTTWRSLSKSSRCCEWGLPLWMRSIPRSTWHPSRSPGIWSVAGEKVAPPLRQIPSNAIPCCPTLYQDISDDIKPTRHVRTAIVFELWCFERASRKLSGVSRWTFMCVRIERILASEIRRKALQACTYS